MPLRTEQIWMSAGKLLAPFHWPLIKDWRKISATFLNQKNPGGVFPALVPAFPSELLLCRSTVKETSPPTFLCSLFDSSPSKMELARGVILHDDFTPSIMLLDEVLIYLNWGYLHFGVKLFRCVCFFPPDSTLMKGLRRIFLCLMAQFISFSVF